MGYHYYLSLASTKRFRIQRSRGSLGNPVDWEAVDKILALRSYVDRVEPNLGSEILKGGWKLMEIG